MNKINIKIWGRDFELPLSIKTFDAKQPTDIQHQAIESFMQSQKAIDGSQENVEKYILENSVDGNNINKVDNIFKYVMPKCIYVPKDKNRVIAILCYYKFDMEHGLSVVFENEKFKSVGSEDEIL